MTAEHFALSVAMSSRNPSTSNIYAYGILQVFIYYFCYFLFHVAASTCLEQNGHLEIHMEWQGQEMVLTGFLNGQIEHTQGVGVLKMDT